MKEQIMKILGPIKNFWDAQDRKRKGLILGIAGGVIAVAIIITAILNYTNFEVLYEGLDSAEAAEIYAQIDGMGVEAKLTSGGTISVPKEQVNVLYADLAAKGYPKSSLNYSVFSDNVNMFSTNYELREYSKMQTQERLASIIKGYDAVSEAAVTLNIPETKTTVISSSTKKPSASVSVTLQNNGGLSPSQITGIQNMVAAAVTGLDPADVVIVDGDLNFLTADGFSGDGIDIERQKLQFKKQYEDTFKEAIVELLAPGYGEDNIKVAVSADLNYDKQVSELTQYSPSHDDGSGMVQHEDHSNSSGASDTGGDVVGVEPNADDTYPTGDVGSSDVWSESSSSVSYLVTTLKQQTEKAGFTVDGLTVSVMIYNDTGFLADATKAELTSIVAKATGVYEERVMISSLSRFGTTELPTMGGTGYPFNWTRQIFFIVMAAILALIIVFLFLYINVSGKAKRKRRAIDKRMAAISRALSANGNGTDGSLEDEEANVASLLDKDTTETREEAIRREIQEFAHQNPAMVAQLIKSWLREDGDDK